MKTSIAKGITRRITAILLVALAILFVSTYFFVRNIILSKTKTYNEVALRTFTDMIFEAANEENHAIDQDFALRIHEIGEYVCETFDIDFAYLMTPEFTVKEKVKYLCVAQSSYYNEINPDDKYINEIRFYTLSPEEQKAWNGEIKYSHHVTESSRDHELSTMTRIMDNEGNVYLAGVDQSNGALMNQIWHVFIKLAIIIIIVLVGIYLLVYFIITKRVSKPAEIVSKSMDEFITNDSYTEKKLPVNGNDEFAVISGAFNRMTENIHDYITNINCLTHEKEQQNTQLEVASNIQRGLLKDPYFEADGYLVYADMIPAKQVAGDLYDYMKIDDNNILTVIADVSGKGVSASIFMAITLVLIREFAKLRMSPSEILAKVNDNLCENNPNLLFLTAIVGIYNTETNEFTYSNAGHNVPYVLSKNVKKLTSATNTLLGLFEGETYEETTIKLNSGDTLFFYTDGVTEAINKHKEFFGDDRLLETLKSFTTSKKENLVDFVKESVEAFMGEQEKFDDMTMLAFSPAKIISHTIEAKVSEFTIIRDEIMNLPISETEARALCLAAEECFVNICNYAYDDKIGYVSFSISVSNRITLRFRDLGKPFNPTEKLLDIDDYDIDTAVGGLGRFIAFNNVDDAKYEYKNGCNILSMTKFINITEETT